MTQHTPTPWKKRKSTNWRCHEIRDANDHLVASVPDQRNLDTIAAAPELLALCRKSLKIFRRVGQRDMAKSLQSIIAKAEGRQ